MSDMYLKPNFLRDRRIDIHTAEVTKELRRAYEKFPRPQRSAHEGYAVLLEEVDELWDDIKRNDIEHARKEAVQVAAMAIRFLVDTEGTPDA